ncbi:MAG: hypothetical protein JJ878_03560, partial [Alphaproteobacteria bacterium]|nr:hypothetical protein [Alphaproteobacteria bacterium]
LCPVYRNAEGSATHSPEFRMLEWYRAGAGYTALMDDCEAMIAALIQDGKPSLAKPPARFISNTIDGAHEAARAGIGIVRLLSYQVAGAIAEGSLVPLLQEFEPDPVPVHVVHLEGRNSPMRIRSFIDYLVEELRQEPVLRND